ncbi:hypothetical protein ACIQB4_29895 [Streptomyces griseoluteus]|uniref:hypothetical protein n=1 Tax=Streptomyces griseoluteus TaxID=29306 RepID=UPI0038171EC1
MDELGEDGVDGLDVLVAEIEGFIEGIEGSFLGWRDVWYLITHQDENIPPAAQRWMAKRAHSHTTEINASHAATVSHVIEQAATTR